MSVQNPDRVVTKQDLKDFYDEISPYLGGGGGGATYTAGDGINIDENNEISADSMQSGEMDDIVTPLPSVRRGYHKYSTEEQVVGEWIDGKPVYEKTAKLDIGNTFITDHQIFSANEVENLIDWCGLYIRQSDNRVQSIPYLPDTSSNYDGYIKTGYLNNITGMFKFQFGVSAKESALNTSIYLTFTYTKTTD